MTRSTLAATALFAMMLGYTAFAEHHENHATMPPQTQMHIQMMDAINHAVAVMVPTQGNTTRGTVRFEQADTGVTVTAEISGLTPGAQHAIHVHEFGDLTAPDGTSAGGHYNPEGHDHGLPEQQARHAGDLGNLTADEQGNAHYEITVDNITVAGMTNPVIGRGVIIHAQTDDGGQPTGNAGARISMGVIGVTK